MTSPRPLIAGNWKMNVLRADVADLAGALATRLRREGPAPFEMLVCPPATLLGEVGAAIAGSGISLGGQDCHPAVSGPHTGDVSAEMLSDAGCRYVIVGHSERRQLYGEADAQVAAKFAAVQSAGLLPILCVGETLEERDTGSTEQVVARQLDAVVQRCGKSALAQAVLAYEPVWAIGTGRTATPEQAQAVHAFLRKRIEGDTPILYGGSVKAANAAALFGMPDVDGGLIGGASLVAADFLAIARAAGN
jgi:triosephosphate isomerase (TIM)